MRSEAEIVAEDPTAVALEELGLDAWLDCVGDHVASEALRAKGQLTLTQFSPDEMNVLEGMYGRGLAAHAAAAAIVAWRG